MPRSRRRSLQFAGALVAASALPGCNYLTEDRTVGIRIENRDDRRHAIEVELESGSDAAYRDRHEVSPGGSVRTPDAVEAGEYTATAVLDSSEAVTMNFDMNGCPSNSLWVVIDDSGELALYELDEC